LGTSRLKIYNGALRILGERKLASLTESREPRFLCDDEWNDGLVRYALERGQWRFAMRTSRLDYSTDITPAFGLRYGFEKPTDWVDTSAVCSDEYFNTPLTRYADEVGYWFSDLTQIFVKYVSDDEDYGADVARWPYSFTEYVKALLASRIAARLTSGKEIVNDLLQPRSGLVATTLVTAKNRDAMAGPTTFPAQGNWSLSRQGRSSSRRGGWNDGGNRGSLVG